MKHALPLFVFLLTSFTVNCQTQLFKNYNFNEGGYAIIGTFWNSWSHPIKDSLGEFYTEDIKQLNKFKKAFTFSKPGVGFACGYHYTLYLCRDGKIIQSISINLECCEIATNGKYYYFDPNIMRQFYNQLNYLKIVSVNFNNLYEARGQYKILEKNENLLLMKRPLWLKFDGHFVFRFDCKGFDCIDDEKQIVAAIENQIKEKYPNYDFYMEQCTYSSEYLEFKLYCKKSMYEKFTLFTKRKNTTFEEWDERDLSIGTYWRTKKK